MQKENIHIVFGRIGKRTLIDSNVIDLNKNQIISFDDILNIGPTCDINANEDIQKRINWLQKVFGANPNPPVEQDIKSIEAIVKHVDNINSVFIWTGHCASEIISTARLIYHLSKFDKPISIANFNTPVRSIRGDIIYPKALNQTATFQVKDIFEQFEIIDKSKLTDYISLWEKVKSENGELWICDNNGKINVEKTDYFDSYLLSHCNENFQKAARIIGETLVDTDFDVGDSYLNWRLKQLSLNGKIETQGKLIEIRDYEVKKITTANKDVKGEIQSLKLEVKNTNNQQVIFGGYGPPPSDSKIPILEKEIEQLKKRYNSDKSSIDPNASFFGSGRLNIAGLKQKFDTPEVSMQLFQIRYNLEELITKIWNNYNEYFSQKNRVLSPTRMLNDLRDIDLLDRDIIGLTRDVLAICNAAIHGREVSEKQIEFVINNGKVIYNTLYDLVGNE